MKNSSLILIGAAASLISSTAVAQSAFDGSTDVDDRIDALNESIADDMVRDVDAFGNQGRPVGFDGAVALQAQSTSGNTDTTAIGIGSNLGYYDGTNGYDLQLSYQYADTAGTVTEDSLLYELEYTRDLGTAYYGFAKLQGTVEGFDETSDNFLGFGLGYKIYNSRDLQWTVDAGVGYRVADLSGVDDLDEAAISVSSSYFNRINDVVSFSNDTDIISSDSDTVYYNDLGLNVAMTETLAMRTSLVTEYHTNPTAGDEYTDNAIGVSLVYNFD